MQTGRLRDALTTALLTSAGLSLFLLLLLSPLLPSLMLPELGMAKLIGAAGALTGLAVGVGGYLLARRSRDPRQGQE